jgi:hypothetical protein
MLMPQACVIYLFSINVQIINIKPKNSKKVDSDPIISIIFKPYVSFPSVFFILNYYSNMLDFFKFERGVYRLQFVTFCYYEFKLIKWNK